MDTHIARLWGPDMNVFCELSSKSDRSSALPVKCSLLYHGLWYPTVYRYPILFGYKTKVLSMVSSISKPKFTQDIWDFLKFRSRPDSCVCVHIFYLSDGHLEQYSIRLVYVWTYTTHLTLLAMFCSLLCCNDHSWINSCESSPYVAQC